MPVSLVERYLGSKNMGETKIIFKVILSFTVIGEQNNGNLQLHGLTMLEGFFVLADWYNYSISSVLWLVPLQY